jgi:hypothetical protein
MLESMIRVTTYFDTGRESNSRDCPSIAEAFDMCQRYGMTAHAVNLRTDRLYIWRPEVTNTFAMFTAKLADHVAGTGEDGTNVQPW